MFKTQSMEKVVFVSNMGEDSISVINLKTMSEDIRIYLLPEGGDSDKGSILLKKPRIGPTNLKIDSKENLYSVNCYDDSISIIDTCNHVVKDTFFVGNYPNDMVFGSDESFMYVTNGDSNCVSIIESLSKKIIGQIPSGPMPQGMCISPDGEYIYVANMGDDSITVIDTWSNSKVSCIGIGTCPNRVIASADGKYIYVTCSSQGYDINGFILVLSTQNLGIIKRIEVGKMPSQMAISKDNNCLFVSNMGSGDIYIIDLNRLQVKNKIRAGNMSGGIDKIDGNYIIVANNQDNNISLIDLKYLKVLKSIKIGMEPTSVLFINKTMC